MNLTARAYLVMFGVLGALTGSALGAATLTVDDPRPVARVVQTLVSQYGYAITYEDPPYEYGDDVEDVTSQVRKDLDKHPPGKAPKVLIPRRDKLNLNVPSITDASDIGTTLNLLVQMKRDHGGHFRVVESGSVFHVIPTEVRDTNGNWHATSSILDAQISIPRRDRNESELIDTICAAIGSAAHVNVWVATGVGQGIRAGGPPVQYNFEAHNEIARDVLMRALTATNPAKLTWVLLYDALTKTYALSILGVPDKSPKSPISHAEVLQPHVTGPSLPPCTAVSTDPRQCTATKR